MKLLTTVQTVAGERNAKGAREVDDASCLSHHVPLSRSHDLPLALRMNARVSS
jgi:hypothetical protein